MTTEEGIQCFWWDEGLCFENNRTCDFRDDEDARIHCDRYETELERESEEL